MKHGEFRTPHALMFDAKGRLWVADRGNHRLEIFDQEGKYLESRYMFGRPSGFFIKGNLLYVIDSESGPLNHPNWRDGVRIGPVDEDRVTGVHPAVRSRGPRVSGHGGRRHRGRCGRQRLRGGRAELAGPGGRRVHQVLGEVTGDDGGARTRAPSVLVVAAKQLRG